jgi:hypothetical protein
VAGLPINRKLAVAALVIGRIAARNRYVNAAWSAATAVGRTVLRAFHRLALEISAFVFLVFAALGGFAAYREYPSLQSGEASLVRIAIICLFTLVFLWFGLSSLWRARRTAAIEKPSRLRNETQEPAK